VAVLQRGLAGDTRQTTPSHTTAFPSTATRFGLICRFHRARAYIYAFLAFVCSLCKAQAEVQHLWFGRRAATRIRSELMAAIYDKTLKRKDFSGIIDKVKQKEKEADAASAQKSSKEEKEKAAKVDDPKAGADVGKIVNLMAGDASQVSQVVSALYFLYGAPFEILIAATFLFQMLGWSAFAGFLILLAGWLLNSYIARRSIRIEKGLLAASDKRMGVLNELIGAVKFIKFFAWEERWIGRALDSRCNGAFWSARGCVEAWSVHRIQYIYYACT